MVWHKGWDDIFEGKEWSKYPPEELIRFIAINFYKYTNRKDVKILEVGSGTGSNLWYCAREGFDVTGIDGSQIGIDQTIKRFREESMDINTFVGDIVNLPFDDKTFDCVIDVECLCSNSYKNSKLIVSEINRVLKSKGKFFSKTFMKGSEGYGDGEKFEDEENTFIESFKGTSVAGCGIIRFTSEDEIIDLHKPLKVDSIDYSTRTKNNRKSEIKEWVIVCSKL